MIKDRKNKDPTEKEEFIEEVAKIHRKIICI